MSDHEVQRYAFLKTEAALARLALQRLCNRYGLDLDSEMYDQLDLEELFGTMKDLQEEAVRYSEKILEEPDPWASCINQS